MYCPRCGTHNEDENYKCIQCSQILLPFQQTAHVPSDKELLRLIPYTNPSALISYYLGVFSIIPLFGIVLGMAAFILGIIGLRAARKRPEIRGKIHAWVGIITGGLFGFGYLVLVLLSVGVLIFDL